MSILNARAAEAGDLDGAGRSIDKLMPNGLTGSDRSVAARSFALCFAAGAVHLIAGHAFLRELHDLRRRVEDRCHILAQAGTGFRVQQRLPPWPNALIGDVWPQLRDIWRLRLV